MATIYWRGGVQAVKEKQSFTPANVEVGDIFTVLAASGTKSISFTATAATVQNVVEGLQALCDASTIPEFAECTWTEDDTALYAEANTAGVDIYFTTAESDGGGTDDQTFLAGQVTANTGPYSWDDADNWSTGSVPTDSDHVIIENTNVPIKYGIDGVSFLSLKVRNVGASFQLGLPSTNEDGTAYPEWRTQSLTRTAGAITCSVTLDSVSQLIKIDTDSDKVVARVLNSGTQSGTEAPVQFTGTHTDNEYNVDKAANVDIAGTFETLRVAFIGTQASDATVTIASTATHKAAGTITQTGGVIYCHANVINVVQNAGEGARTACKFYLYGSSTCSSWTCRGASAYSQSSGTITTFAGSGAGTLDKRGDNRAQTITTPTIYSESFIVNDPQGVLVPTNGYATGENNFDSRNAGFGKTWTPS